MTPRALQPDPAPAHSGFEVATISSDVLRASVRVAGALSARTCPLLRGVLIAHLRAGRRYLRVNLAGASVDDLAVLEPLRAMHSSVAELGGMLVFDNASEEATEVLHGGDLFVSTPL
jgi:anti-anti-sigma regulatory factor